MRRERETWGESKDGGEGGRGRGRGRDREGERNISGMRCDDVAW